MTTGIGQLNAFLRGEISAVETYRQALRKADNLKTRAQLEQCHMSHQRRVDLLRTRIAELGGEPSEGSGTWGMLAKMAEGGAGMFGEKAAIDILDQGEGYGLNDYRSHLDQLDAASRAFVETELLPDQEITRRTVSSLKHTLH